MIGRNRSDLVSLSLHQRVMTGISAPKLETQLLGATAALPIVLAPVGSCGMFARRGEVQAARAAHAAGIPFCLSTVSICSLTEVQAASASPVWFQLYIMRDRAFMRDLLDTVKQAGCQTLVLTVDMPVPGTRYRDYRSGMRGPYAKLRQYWQALHHPRWAWDVGLHGRPHTLGNVQPVLGNQDGLEDYMGWLAKNFDPSLRWSDLEWIRANWPGTLVIKGVLHAEDAKQSIALGANCLVVSNHGGRQLDAALSSCRALRSVVDAVGDAVTVLADSGVRSGIDVIKMLALGAKGVLLGRAWAYALAADGEAGVARLLQMFRDEMRTAMILAGIDDVNAIDSSVLADLGTQRT